MTKKVVGVVCGGFTSEAEVSKKSGKMVFDSLSRDRWDVYLIVVSPKEWIVFDDQQNSYPLSKGDFTFVRDKNRVRIDVVFNAIHGAPGENGQLAALFELLEIPHSSCDSYAAALTYNKRDCLSILKNIGVSTARSYHLDKNDAFSTDQIMEAIGLPCFVKANRAGSSFGVYKVTEKKALLPAIKNAFNEDEQLIIESALKGKELSVGAVDWNGEITVLPITEIISHNDFFDYKAKYEGQSEEITPAKIDVSLKKAVSDLTIRIYKKLRLKGITRSEFIIVDGVPHLLEINTIPGLTAQSIIPQQLAAKGIQLSDFFGSLLETAMKIHNKRLEQ